MCNRYRVKGTDEELSLYLEASRGMPQHRPIAPSVPRVLYPDAVAPVVRASLCGGRELVHARWGMPGPPMYGGHPVTNIRNTKSAHWRRCLVPVTSFCEWEDTKPRKTPTWFALDESRPIAVFAGIWTTWNGVRGTKANPVEGNHELFGFLTTEPNEIVAPIHPKAMPVILTTLEEYETWLRAPWPEALQLQRPLPSDKLKIVSRGSNDDESTV